jgi:hypothetical protein
LKFKHLPVTVHGRSWLLLLNEQLTHDSRWSRALSYSN